MPLENPLRLTWTDIPLSADWARFDGTVPVAQYARSEGLVFLRGSVRQIGAGNVIGTLPPGVRPQINQAFSVASFSSFLTVGICQVLTTGAVVYALGGATLFYLDGIVFGVDP